MHQTSLTERRRRRRNIEGGRTSNSGAVLFFDISGLTSGKQTVLVESAKLVLEVAGSGRVGVLQRVAGGSGINLDSLLVEEEREVEMEVRREFHQDDSLSHLKLFCIGTLLLKTVNFTLLMSYCFCCRWDMQSKAGSWTQG